MMNIKFKHVIFIRQFLDGTYYDIALPVLPFARVFVCECVSVCACVCVRLYVAVREPFTQ